MGHCRITTGISSLAHNFFSFSITIVFSKQKKNTYSPSDPAVDLITARAILEQCDSLYPELTQGRGIESLKILRHNVGFRPSRKGGIRIETEVIGMFRIP